MKSSKSHFKVTKKAALLRRVEKALDEWRVEKTDFIAPEEDIKNFIKQLPSNSQDSFKKSFKEVSQSVFQEEYKKLLKKYKMKRRKNRGNR